MKIILIIGIFATTVLLLQQLGYWLSHRSRLIDTRLKETLVSVAAEDSENNRKRDKRRLAEKIRDFVNNFSLPGTALGGKLQKRIRNNLTRSGIPLRIEEFLIINLVGMIIFTLLGYLLQGITLAIIMGLVGLFIPSLWVRICIKRRGVKIEGQLLNVIILMSNSLRAGHSFLQSLEIISKDTPEPLASEFSRALREMKIGVQLEEALLNLGNRVESNDLEMLITGVLIQRQVGGNLAEILDTIAMTIDKRIKTKAKVKTLTAQTRMSAWIISILPFALGFFIFTSRPDYAQIMITEPIGKLMLIMGAIMMILGIFLIKKVVDIDV